MTLNPAVAMSEAQGPEVALDLVETLSDALDGYFYVQGLRGNLLMQVGRKAEARIAFDRAIALARSPAEAAHIRRQLDCLKQDGLPAT